MRTTRLFISLAIAVLSVAAGTFTMTSCHSVLFHDGKSDYVIVLCADASTSEQTAAKELQIYLEKIGGMTLPIVDENQIEDGQKHIFVGFNKEYAEKFNVEYPENDDEGYTYRSVDDNIWIYGGKQRGTIYGVFSFLENELGVRWYSADCTKVPTFAKWEFKDLMHSEKPFVEYRHLNYAMANSNADCLAHNKCNMGWSFLNNEYGGLTGYWGCHTFSYFIST